MHSNNFLQTSLSHTGFPHSKRSSHQGSGVYSPTASTTIAVILGITSMLGTGSIQPSEYHWFSQSKTITATQIKQKIGYKHFIASLTAHEQLIQIKYLMGLNILEIAGILQVSRPTIYDWLESQETTIRKKHQERLNAIYQICQNWNMKRLGRLGSYLHQPIGEVSLSLFDLLKAKSLDCNTINCQIEHIAQLMFAKRQENEAHDAFLKKHGFAPVDREDMIERLNDIDSLD